MKTALFSSSYLDGSDWQGSDRVKRTRRYLDYYAALKDTLGFDHVFLADNGSDPHLVRELGINAVRARLGEKPFISLEHGHEEAATLLWYPEKYLRGSGNDYPYCWRALYAMRDLIDHYGYERIMYIETDAFIVSKRLADYTRNMRSGWTAHQIVKYGFSSAEFHVLCKDAFPIFMEFTDVPFMDHNGKLMEESLPFTSVSSDFNANRYGEYLMPQCLGMDLYAQCPLSISIKYDMGGA